VQAEGRHALQHWGGGAAAPPTQPPPSRWRGQVQAEEAPPQETPLPLSQGAGVPDSPRAQPEKATRCFCFERKRA